VTLPAGGNSTGNNFVDERLGTISGNVKEDIDNNDSGDVNLSGVTIELLSGTTVIASTTTDASGNYSFTNQPAGTYIVKQTNLGGYSDVSDTDAPNDNLIDVTLPAGGNSTGNNFVDERLNGDLSITKTDGLTTVSPGQKVTYTIVVSNNGPNTATNALVSDTIPTTLTNVMWTSVAAGGATDNQASGTGNINDLVTLTSGSSITYTVMGTVAANAITNKLSDFGLGTDDTNLGQTVTVNGVKADAFYINSGYQTTNTVLWQRNETNDHGLGVWSNGEPNPITSGGDVNELSNQLNQEVIRLTKTAGEQWTSLWVSSLDGGGSGGAEKGTLYWSNSATPTLNTLTTKFTFQYGDFGSSVEGNILGLTQSASFDKNAQYLFFVAGPNTAGTNNDYLVWKATTASGTTLTNTATVTAPNGFIDTNPNNNSATDTDTIVAPTGDLSITKTDGVTTVTPGQKLTYTIVVSNNGSGTATDALVSDTIPNNLTGVTWTSVANGGATGNEASGTGNINDLVTLTSGSSITYTVMGTIAANPLAYTPTKINLQGDSALDGPDGNIRTFSASGVSVKASAFSRSTSGTWSSAFLGSFSSGLGVTDSSEGNGDNGTHRVDNNGRDNYVLFEFSESVIVDKAFLDSVVGDSDATVWIGNFSDPFNNHLTLSDSVLNSFGFSEINTTSSSSDRSANLNATKIAGNTLVIAARTDDSSNNDNFKIKSLDIFQSVSGGSTSVVNTATVTAPTGFTDTNPNNNSATDTDTVLAAPGVRTPGFWQNSKWQKFWDGIQGNEPSQKTEPNFPDSDLLFAPYTNSAQPGKVLDPVTGQYGVGLLIGDFNRNGMTDTGEDTLFYTRAQALQIVDSSMHPNGQDVRYTLGRDLVASWLNYLAANPIDTANPTDQDARYYLKEGINWLQALTPDQNGNGKGDGYLQGLTGNETPNSQTPRITSSSSYWNTGISSASGLPSPYNLNNSVTYGVDAGSVIHDKLDDYNNGRGLADGVFYGG
ncbi:SdrD B-like domain-containing protein, partial [Limnofasciculus baicalensis]